VAKKPDKTSVHAALDRLAGAERAFLEQEFLAPVLRGAGVQVRIAGVRCQLKVEPGDFEGWGVFRPASHSLARLVRAASMAERRRYLELFPAVALILCRKDSRDWSALPANRSDGRFEVEGGIPVRLAEEGDAFDTVRARFDGSQFWFDEADGRADPGAAAYLRQSLAALLEPARLDRPGLTAGQREAYAHAHAERLRQEFEDEQARGEGRVRSALAHAGAQLRDFADRGDVYRVTYTVDGRRHTSVVNKSDLTVQSAGVCLSGGDRAFDLHSLVGVLRDGERRGEIRRVPG
jgi:hypothetical protein